MSYDGHRATTLNTCSLKHVVPSWEIPVRPLGVVFVISSQPLTPFLMQYKERLLKNEGEQNFSLTLFSLEVEILFFSFFFGQHARFLDPLSIKVIFLLSDYSAFRFLFLLYLSLLYLIVGYRWFLSRCCYFSFLMGFSFILFRLLVFHFYVLF